MARELTSIDRTDPRMNSPRIPIILDTDIGSDIDDAVCLAYLLRQPRCELVGITTVSGQARARASLADAVCRAAGRRDVPIFAGCEKGILLDTVQPDCPQAAVLPRFAHRTPEQFVPNEAVGFLRDQIHRRPGEISLLAIGPMTNVGLLFAIDPEIVGKLRSLVTMCGVFKRPMGVGAREWNALSDPIATKLVYRAHPLEHVSIGLDVTTRCQLPTEECVARFERIGGPLAVVSAMTSVWAKHAELTTFHDPLAAAVVFEPNLCRYEQGCVEVEIESPHVPGLTLFQPSSDFAPHRVAVDVDSGRFFDHYFSVVTGGGSP
jgi:inosine-uridine nucleoside N-ribohydrolase